ncbi:MAG: hypothetical protein ACETWQ_15610 [Phycisphaerae bacterium]
MYFYPRCNKDRESQKVVSPSVGNLKALRNVSSKMTLKEIKSCIESLEGFKVQNEGTGIISPYWGLFVQVANKLPSKYLEKIRNVIYLEYLGDILKPTSVIIKLDPTDYIKVNNRWIRTIKIKGITNRISMIKEGKFRHIRFLGQGNIPFLLPYMNPDGTREDFRFDVGEPYRAKRFRSVINEVVLTKYALSQDRAVMVPIGMGIYEDDELLYKGEPIAFSIWGIEHPDDLRSGDELDARFFRMLDEIVVATSKEEMWKMFQEALSWMHVHHAQIIAEMRKNHDIGLVHHEVHFNNTLLFDNSLTIMDWEEAAHRYNLSRCQFLDSIVVDLIRLIENCCSEERVYREYYNRSSWLAAESGIEISAFRTVNYFTYYFRENELNKEDREKLQSLREKLLTECKERAALIERFVGKLVLTVFDRGHFGKGINWKDVARPFMPGFSDDNPVWQPEATTTFDPKLFVQKGEWPYRRKKKHPTKAISRAEEAIYEGRFEDAIKIYENILRYGHKSNRDFDSYIHHNLASLYLVLRQDKKAKTHLDLKALL